MNKPLLKQALDALEYSFVLIGLEFNAAVSSDDRSRTAKKRVAEVGARLTAHGGAIDALRAEIAKPEQDSGEVIAELERLYKNAIKREFDLSQALEAAVDNNLDKLMAMTDEQIRSLAGFEGHHPDDLAALARQTCEIEVLKAEIAKPETVIWLHVSDTKMPWDKTLPYKLDFEQDESWACAVQLRATLSAPEQTSQTRNCSRHPGAPHGPDGAGCKCHSWAPGEAS